MIVRKKKEEEEEREKEREGEREGERVKVCGLKRMRGIRTEKETEAQE